jgi:hypothetical protein
MSRLVVKLQRDRNFCGCLILYDSRNRRLCGPFKVAGRSSDALASANGNPSRNPLFRFGDTPIGGYEARDILKSGKGTPFEAAQFGSNGVAVLVGVSGDAALAEANGRFHILIVGGKLSSAGELRSTAGSLRLSDQDQRVLVTQLRKLHDVKCEIEEDVSLKSRQRVHVDSDCQADDPRNLLSNRGHTPSRSINKELLLGGAAGAIMLEVVFVALPAARAHASATPIQQNLQHMRDNVKFLPPIADPSPHYVRLAYGGQALEQLQNAQHQTTGKTFDNSNNAQPSDAVPNGSVSVPGATPSVSVGTASSPAVATPPQSNTGGSAVDQVIQQQRQINAIQSEKPPPNATQEQLNQWQQSQQQRIQNVTKPPTQPSNTAPPAKTN